MESASSVVACDGCQREYRWKPELAGRRVKCKCGSRVTFPQAEEPEPLESEVMEETPDVAPGDDVWKGGEGSGEIDLLPDVVKPKSACPGCNASVVAGAVICTRCGTNLKTGRKINTSVEAQAKPVSHTAEKRAFLLKMLGAAAAIIVVGIIVIVAAPNFALSAGKGIGIGGLILGLLGLYWSTYTATSDNIGLRLACRFVPFLGIIVVTHRAVSDWDEMKVPVLTMLTGIGVGLLGLVLYFGGTVGVLHGAVGG